MESCATLIIHSVEKVGEGKVGGEEALGSTEGLLIAIITEDRGVGKDAEHPTLNNILSKMLIVPLLRNTGRGISN